MSFRRLVHLVVDDISSRRTYSLRSIDMSSLFRPRRESLGVRPNQLPPMEEADNNQEMKPFPLPTPPVPMEFMLLGGRHNQVVATDQTGRAIIYDLGQHAVRTMHRLAAPKSTPVSLTVGDDHLYILDTCPMPGDKDKCFECFEYDHDGDQDWRPRALPPLPYKYYRPQLWESTDSVDSYAAVGDGDDAADPHILISKERFGTYSFDTVARAWSKAGNWTLPFSGRAEYVPEHGLWFGLRDDPCVFCAADLGSVLVRRPPVVHDLWEDLAPPPRWMQHLESHLVHLGSAKFCIARFFTTNPLAPVWPVTQAVFTAVEVERCGNCAGGIRVVKHRSKMYTLLSDMIYWVCSHDAEMLAYSVDVVGTIATKKKRQPLWLASHATYHR
ncbi:hypothetical protein U9M48_037326 [Paspalum notatum var. saurae]|uniref:Uncharacterized protein n=1 Tax=Paspalum notatum var. saurae TaxID=547442 RepID=A0AAQ3UEP3_PASNO